ncbi:MAG: hypothetical protein F6J90_05585 [Moorea sp. SIOASIH]|nr:hypothetical protein [Moorena sp. SIOASIH]
MGIRLGTGISRGTGIRRVTGIRRGTGILPVSFRDGLSQYCLLRKSGAACP